MTRLARTTLAGFIGLLMLGAPGANAAIDQTLAAQVKAALVFNFIRFTEWPPEAFSSAKDPLIVGVVGSGPIAGELADALHGKLLGERPIVVQQFQPDRIGRCHVLYVAAADDKAAAVLGKAAQGTLTVGDWPGFTDAGGIVRFYEEDGVEHFEVNVENAAKAHLQISGKLLKLGKISGKQSAAERE